VDTVTVGRENAGLWFQDVERGPSGEIWYVWARLRVDGLDAPLRVSSHYANGFDELAGFFQMLAADWRGWPGERSYESLEHELRLTARHDGHVRIAVELRQSSLPDGWSASGVVIIDPGEELTSAAEEVTELLSSPRRQKELRPGPRGSREPRVFFAWD
jgi:Family of unknown function (DUF6228)